MAATKLNEKTTNNDRGLFISRSRRVVLDTPFGEQAAYIKAGTAGTIVWKNAFSDEVGIWSLEAGEIAPVACTEILTGATIDGTPETTTATGLIWASNTQDLGTKA